MNSVIGKQAVSLGIRAASGAPRLGLWAPVLSHPQPLIRVCHTAAGGGHPAKSQAIKKRGYDITRNPYLNKVMESLFETTTTALLARCPEDINFSWAEDAEISLAERRLLVKPDQSFEIIVSPRRLQKPNLFKCHPAGDLHFSWMSYTEAIYVLKKSECLFQYNPEIRRSSLCRGKLPSTLSTVALIE
ncbi:hypothetical protein XELAEV_18013883mg [Xenopus laevis]|uniref:Uncharacterized protein n=1 Tax=Xenopus laevis TaxID=8355 RepID=A0A974DQK5_XENLA|nr:hypothetical protein XELAEV_18013883mg [Xenopus laevis]